MTDCTVAEVRAGKRRWRVRLQTVRRWRAGQGSAQARPWATEASGNSSAISAGLIADGIEILPLPVSQPFKQCGEVRYARTLGIESWDANRKI